MTDGTQRAHRLTLLGKSMAADLVENSYEDEEIDAELRQLGADPIAVGSRFANLVRDKLADHRRLAWQRDARNRLDQARAVLASTPEMPPWTTRGEAINVLEALRSGPHGAQIHTAFRNKTPEMWSDEELNALIRDIRGLLALSARGAE